MMLETVPCNLCGSDSFDVLHPSTLGAERALRAVDYSCTNLGRFHHHRIVRCRKCGLIYSNPRDAASTLDGLYGAVRDEPYDVFSRGKIKTFERLLSRPVFSRAKPGTSLLDVGSHIGLFMKLARERNFRVTGIEPSTWAAALAARDYGLRVLPAGIYDARLDEQFDIITLWDVLEHLPDPLRALEICRAGLRGGGTIAISTMRCQGLFYSLSGRYWPWFMRTHLYYFTAATLRKTLERAGFEIRSILPYTHYVDLGYVFFKVLAGDKARLRKKSFIREICIPVQLGDFIEVYAVKAG